MQLHSFTNTELKPDLKIQLPSSKNCVDRKWTVSSFSFYLDLKSYKSFPKSQKFRSGFLGGFCLFWVCFCRWFSFVWVFCLFLGVGVVCLFEEGIRSLRGWRFILLFCFFPDYHTSYYMILINI